MQNHSHIAPLPVGTRVEIHPATDAWMMGDRYGVVVSFRCPRNGRHMNGVQMDKSHRVRQFAPDTLTVIGEVIA